jgi:hypothetical protein
MSTQTITYPTYSKYHHRTANLPTGTGTANLGFREELAALRAELCELCDTVGDFRTACLGVWDFAGEYPGNAAILEGYRRQIELKRAELADAAEVTDADGVHDGSYISEMPEF